MDFTNSLKFRVEVGGWREIPVTAPFNLRFCNPPPSKKNKKEAEEVVTVDLNLRHSIFRCVVFCLGSIKKSVQKWYCASFAPKQINIQESEHDEGHTYAHSNRDHFAPSTTEKSIFNPLFQLCSRYLSTISSTIKKYSAMPTNIIPV